MNVTTRHEVTVLTYAHPYPRFLESVLPHLQKSISGEFRNSMGQTMDGYATTDTRVFSKIEMDFGMPFGITPSTGLLRKYNLPPGWNKFSQGHFLFKVKKSPSVLFTEGVCFIFIIFYPQINAISTKSKAPIINM